MWVQNGVERSRLGSPWVSLSRLTQFSSIFICKFVSSFGGRDRRRRGALPCGVLGCDDVCSSFLLAFQLCLHTHTSTFGEAFGNFGPVTLPFLREDEQMVQWRSSPSRPQTSMTPSAAAAASSSSTSSASGRKLVWWWWCSRDSMTSCDRPFAHCRI